MAGEKAQQSEMPGESHDYNGLNLLGMGLAPGFQGENAPSENARQNIALSSVLDIQPGLWYNQVPVL